MKYLTQGIIEGQNQVSNPGSLAQRYVPCGLPCSSAVHVFPVHTVHRMTSPQLTYPSSWWTSRLFLRGADLNTTTMKPLDSSSVFSCAHVREAFRVYVRDAGSQAMIIFNSLDTVKLFSKVPIWMCQFTFPGDYSPTQLHPHPMIFARTVSMKWRITVLIPISWLFMKPIIFLFLLLRNACSHPFPFFCWGAFPRSCISSLHTLGNKTFRTI